jgi:two-component system response regulator
LKVLNGNEVIYVDDSVNDREIVAECYSGSRLENRLVTMGSGEDLLRHLEEVVQGLAHLPALILLDVNMPVMDGFEVLRTIRAKPALRDVPLIMLTGSDSLSDRERAMALGANDLKVKPCNLEDYVTLFDSLSA